MLPVGFILTMYTETGYDASAHTAEETENAAVAAAKGIWQSIFYSAIIGWILLLAFLFAANDVGAVNDGAGFVGRDLHQLAWIHGPRSYDPDRDDRSALLRDRLSDQRVADVVRVLARPGDPGMGDLPPGEPRQGAV